MKKEREKFTINGHFIGKKEVLRQTYDELLRKLRMEGPLVENPRKTSIHLVRSTTLAGVTIKQDYLILTFKSDKSFENPRIKKSERMARNRYHLKMKLTAPSDINHEVVSWLSHAYALSA